MVQLWCDLGYFLQLHSIIAKAFYVAVCGPRNNNIYFICLRAGLIAAAIFTTNLFPQFFCH